MEAATRQAGLTGNQLKILAMIAMTCDHVGLELLPGLSWLRIVGRLALPIYAYMIAEGCRHTRDPGRYLLRLAGMAALCQIVYFFAEGSLYMCILVTFSLSVCLIRAMEGSRSTALAAVTAVGVVCIALPRLIPGFYVDYGFFGVLLPVAVYFGKSKEEKLLYLALILILLAAQYGGIQWFSLAALPLLGFYSGKRGARSIGRLFYWYYPLHLAAIYGISLIV